MLKILKVFLRITIKHTFKVCLTVILENVSNISNI